MGKNQPPRESLDFSILLSFNELAWVAVCGMALFCSYNIVKNDGDADPAPKPAHYYTNEISRLSSNVVAVTRLSNQFSNRVTQLDRKVAELTKALAISRYEILSISNRFAEFREQTGQLSNELGNLKSLSTDLANRLALVGQSNEFLRLTLKTLESNSLITNQVLANLKARLEGTASEVGIRQELLNLRGPMRNVVILIDRSGSMNEGNRWNDAMSVMVTWLRYLPIQRCALVIFSDGVETFPADGTMIDVSGAYVENRDKLLRHLATVRPDGNTHTLAALEQAYKYPEVDTIILFTDGEPYVPNWGKSAKPSFSGKNEVNSSKGDREKVSAQLVKAILALSLQHTNVPVNAVALGDYFQEAQSKFLLELVRRTGGAFLGR
jgi:hypothetical protein